MINISRKYNSKSSKKLKKPKNIKKIKTLKLKKTKKIKQLGGNREYVQVPDNLTISQTSHFKQYIFDNKLVTLIGEEHRPFYSQCQVNNFIFKLPEYIIDVLKKDDKSILLMEYDPSLKIKNVEFKNSLNIIEVKNGLIRNRLKPKVFGIDNRRQFSYFKEFMGNKVDMSTIIYGFTNGYSNTLWLPISSLLHKDGIVYSISTNKDHIFQLNPNDYNPDKFKQLDNFRKEILNNIAYFKSKIHPVLKKENQDMTIGQYIGKEIEETYRIKAPEKIQHLQKPAYIIRAKINIGRENINLMDYLIMLWASIVDFNTLKIIYNKQNVNIIVIIGGQHVINLDKQIRKILGVDKIFSATKSGGDNCFNIKGSMFPK